MLDLVAELRRTAIAEWERTAFGSSATRSTRLRFCDAVLAHLDGLSAGTGFATVVIAREDLLRVTGHHSGSTLYKTFKEENGRDEVRRTPLVARLDGGMREVLGRADVVALAVAETKVLTYRPERDGWLTGLEEVGHVSRRFAAESLVRVLAAWAARMPRLAQAAGHAPPLSAVQDLYVIAGGEARLPDVAAVLIRVTRTVAELPGASPPVVLNVVHEELMALLAIGNPPYAGELAREAKALLSEIDYLWPRLGPAERADATAVLARVAGGLLRQMDVSGDEEDGR